jgi:hypothetical protein
MLFIPSAEHLLSLLSIEFLCLSMGWYADDLHAICFCM